MECNGFRLFFNLSNLSQNGLGCCCSWPLHLTGSIYYSIYVFDSTSSIYISVYGSIYYSIYVFDSTSSIYIFNP
jgi:hypothetical protein